jgi:hypothetical protein
MNDFHQAHGPEHDPHLGELAEELRLLAEVLLERVEPVLRRAAADGRAEWAGCSWCPLCAAAALARGEHHDVVASLAAHGTAIVTVLREALAGVPVEPVMPDGDVPEGDPSAEGMSGEGTPADAEPGDVLPGDVLNDAVPQAGSPDERADPFGAADPITGGPNVSKSAHTDRTGSGTADSGAQTSSGPPAGGRPRYVSIPVQIKV